MTDRSFEVGPIRPPSEANSLLLQVARGCTWNKCKFCVVYRGDKFHMHQPDELKRTIDNMAYFRDMIASYVKTNGTLDREGLTLELGKLTQSELECFYMVYRWLSNGGTSVFLQDGNTVALKADKLADVLFYLREKFPQIERITTYGRAESIARHSLDELKLLRQSGLNRIHSGFETGSDNVLKLINKGLTQAQQIDAGVKAKEAGIELSVYFMPGIGGVEYSDENARETAHVINQISPDFVRFRTFVLKYDSEMVDLLRNGLFEECTDIQKLREIRNIIADVTAPDVTIVSDHIINLIGSLGGRIGTDKEKMLAQADRVLNLPPEEQRLYQLARRHGFIEDYPQLASIPQPRLLHLRGAAEKYYAADQWEAHLNDILRNYV